MELVCTQLDSLLLPVTGIHPLWHGDHSSSANRTGSPESASLWRRMCVCIHELYRQLVSYYGNAHHGKWQLAATKATHLLASCPDQIAPLPGCIFQSTGAPGASYRQLSLTRAIGALVGASCCITLHSQPLDPLFGHVPVACKRTSESPAVSTAQGQSEPFPITYAQ